MTFKNTHLSVSRVRLYEQCARAFYFRYVAKVESGPLAEAPAFGVVLHEALETTYAWVMAEEYRGLFPMAVLLEAYQTAWRASSLTGVALYQEGLNLLRTYAKSHDPVDCYNILDVEKEFNIRVGDFAMNGFIDRVDKLGDGWIGILDYKSNRKLYRSEELDDDLQMSMYGLAARVLYPWATRISFVFHMLRFDTHQSTTRTAAQIDDAAGYVVQLGRKSETDTVWAPKLNENCAYCDYRTRCDAYQAELAEHRPGTRLDKLGGNLASLVEERMRVARIAKLAYSRRHELDKILAKRIEEEGDFVTNEGVQVRMAPQFETTYPREKVLRLLEKAGFPRSYVEDRVLKVDKEAVDALRQDVDARGRHAQAVILKAELEAIQTQVPRPPKLDAWKKKK